MYINLMTQKKWINSLKYTNYQNLFKKKNAGNLNVGEFIAETEFILVIIV